VFTEVFSDHRLPKEQCDWNSPFIVPGMETSYSQSLSLWKKPEYPEKTTDHGQATGQLYHMQL
jgi:hypothetical protein